MKKNYIEEYKALLNDLGGHYGKIAEAMEMSQVTISQTLKKRNVKKYQYLALLGLKTELNGKKLI